MQKEMMLRTFLRRLTPTRLREHVRLISPFSRSAAPDVAERAKVVLHDDDPRLPTPTPHVQPACVPRQRGRLCGNDQDSVTVEHRAG